MSRFLSRFCHITYNKVIHDVEFVLFTSPSIGELCESTISRFIFLARLAWMLRQFEIRLHYHFSALLDQWWLVSVSAFFQENMKNRSITVHYFLRVKIIVHTELKLETWNSLFHQYKLHVTGVMNVKNQIPPDLFPGCYPILEYLEKKKICSQSDTLRKWATRSGEWSVKIHRSRKIFVESHGSCSIF